MNIVMEQKMFLFAFLVFCWFEQGVQGVRCRQLDFYNLTLRDNSVVEGHDFGENWYASVEWLKPPSDETMFEWVREAWISNSGWKERSRGNISLCDIKATGEEGSYLIQIIRELLGLPGCCNVPVGVRETDDDFFGSNSPCHAIEYEDVDMRKKQRIFVNLHTPCERLMSGQLVLQIPK